MFDKNNIVSFQPFKGLVVGRVDNPETEIDEEPIEDWVHQKAEVVSNVIQDTVIPNLLLWEGGGLHDDKVQLDPPLEGSQSLIYPSFTNEDQNHDEGVLELLEQGTNEPITQGERLPHQNQHHDEDEASEHDLDGLDYNACTRK